MKEQLIKCQLLLSLLFFSNLQAQVVDPIAAKPSAKQDILKDQTQIDKKQLEAKRAELILSLKSLSNLEISGYIEQLDSIRNEVDDYIENKRKECLGELASIVINDLGDQELVKRKLSKDEKKVCMHQLKIFNTFYVGQIFDSRKEFLAKVHIEQLKHIEEVKDELMDDLEKRYKLIDQELSGRRKSSSTRRK